MTDISNMRARRGAKAGKEGEADRVYRTIKGWLIECKLPPGDIISEVDIAHDCQTSRTPVREACNRLAQDGWIKLIRNKGYLIPAVSIRELLQLYDYRKLLECFTAERAAQLASPEQLQKLAHIIEVEQPSDGATRDLVLANDQFHLTIAEIAGNERVYAQLKLTLEFVRRLDALSFQQSYGWFEHGDIVAALQSRKPADARQAMAAHIEGARDRMLNLFARS